MKNKKLIITTMIMLILASTGTAMAATALDESTVPETVPVVEPDTQDTDQLEAPLDDVVLEEPSDETSAAVCDGTCDGDQDQVRLRLCDGTGDGTCDGTGDGEQVRERAGNGNGSGDQARTRAGDGTGVCTETEDDN